MEACFSGPSIALLTAMLGALTTSLGTVFWLLIRAKDAQVVKAEAREAEWRRVALRGNEIIPDLAKEVRAQVRDRYPELREPEPR